MITKTNHFKQTLNSGLPTVCTLLLLLIFTLYYRKQFFASEQRNRQLEQVISTFAIKSQTLLKQHHELQEQYQSNYEQMLSISKTDFKGLREKLKTVENMYSLHRQLYAQSYQTQQLTLNQRITRLENLINEQETTIEYLENILKDQIREQKYKKMDSLQHNPYFQSQSMKSNWQLLKGNIDLPFTTAHQRQQLQKHNKKQEIRLEGIYQLSHYPKELPFCIIVPSYNNVRNFRYEFNLQSILNQDYENYHVVIIDDASPDQTGLHIARFLKKHQISSEKVTLIRNEKQVTAVPNLHLAATQHCRANQIGFFLDGDDELVGRLAFKIFNAVYQAKKPAVAYSIAFEWWVIDNIIKDNWSQEYTQIEKKNNQYRMVPQKISHLRSFRIDLYRQIKQKDLKFPNGEWFSSTYDQVICLPMMEMSCGNIEVIHEYLYLYVYGTGYNDREVDGAFQQSIARLVKHSYPSYECDPRFLANATHFDLEP